MAGDQVKPKVSEMVLQLEGTESKPRVAHIVTDPKQGESKGVRLEVTTSKDGKSITVNGKVVPLPKQGESKTITIEATPEGGKSKAVILHLKQLQDGASIEVDGKGSLDLKHPQGGSSIIQGGASIRLYDKVIPAPEKGGKKVITFVEGNQGAHTKNVIVDMNKDGHSPQITGKIVIDENGQAKTFLFNGIETKESVEGAHPHLMKIIEDRPQADGKPMTYKFEDKMPLYIQEGKQPTVVSYFPGGATQAKSFLYSTQTAPAKPGAKTESAKGPVPVIVNFDSKVRTETQAGKAQTWTIVGSGPKTQVLNRTTYNLPKGKAAAVAAFLKENLKGTGLETKVDGDSLVVTASPEVHKAIGSLLSLMQSKAATGSEIKVQPGQMKYELKFTPDGKNSSDAGTKVQPFVNWTTTAPVSWTTAAPVSFATWSSMQPSIGWAFAPAKSEKKAEGNSSKEKP